MGKYPKEAAAYKGRVMMKIWGYDEKRPKSMKITDFKDEDPAATEA